MSDLGLSYNTRKALRVHLGEDAGNELANLIQKLGQRVEALERNKVNVTRIVPADLVAPIVNANPSSDSV
ncbi:MAG: hypothetical protein QGG36_32420 [Pirellulaceae bacterium]|jgi:hypothetical protein|nr:hypothetical protein [Pirellulaceae bacterium]MDP7020550.1 hypothetical protein [Pirellulaceae bacterium]